MMQRSQLLVIPHVQQSRLLLQHLPHCFDSAHPCRTMHRMEQRILQPQVLFMDRIVLSSKDSTCLFIDSTAM